MGLIFNQCDCDNVELLASIPGGGGVDPEPCVYGEYIIKRYDLNSMIHGDTVFFSYSNVAPLYYCGSFTPLTFTYQSYHIDINAFINDWIANIIFINGVNSVTNYGNGIIEFKFEYQSGKECCNTIYYNDITITTGEGDTLYSYYAPKEQLCCSPNCVDTNYKLYINLAGVTDNVTVTFEKLNPNKADFCGTVNPYQFNYQGFTLLSRQTTLMNWLNNVVTTNIISIQPDPNYTSLLFTFNKNPNIPCCGYDFYYDITQLT